MIQFLGKQVIIPEYMPDIEKTSTKPIAFGDFPYYWIVGKKPVTVRIYCWKNLYCSDQIGYLAFEFLDWETG